MRKLIFISFLLLFGLNGFGQKHDVDLKIKEGELYFKEVIGDSLYTLTVNRKVKKKYRIHKNNYEAVQFLRPKLNEKFGNELIENQSPFFVGFYNGYYMVWGSLPKGKTGEVFLVIMDSETLNIEVMKNVKLVKPQRVIDKNKK